MAANKRTKLERERDRSIIAELYLSKFSQTEIPVKLKELTGANYTLSRQQISYDIKWIIDEIRSQRIHDTNYTLNIELARIDVLERQFWQAWRKSDKKEPRYLDGVLKCIERRCKLLGLDAPQKFNINEVVTGFSIDVIKNKIHDN